EAILGDLPSLNWFRENFESVGRVRVEHFAENFRRLIPLVRARTGARVIVFNHLTIIPGDLTHNYQSGQAPQQMRWEEFGVARADLSRELDFSVVDMDRILKGAGTGQ